jgi:hypothetical protein
MKKYCKLCVVDVTVYELNNKQLRNIIPLNILKFNIK